MLVKGFNISLSLNLKTEKIRGLSLKKKKHFTYGHLRKLLQLGNVCENARLYFLLKLLVKHFIILVLMISHGTVNNCDLVYSFSPDKKITLPAGVF